jgi:hypothetical protein
MKEGLARFVLCTSTLAQGVNLPIRYLIISGTMQGTERIKARDFHNLVGRAGRAGMHTEGTILFSDPSLYDNRAVFEDRWRWDAATKLLNVRNTEATASSLLEILSPFENTVKNNYLTMGMVPLLIAGLKDPAPVLTFLSRAAKQHQKLKYTEGDLHEQFRSKIRLLETLESYLMAHRGSGPFSEFLLSSENLARETLAYYLASEDQKQELILLFREIALHIEEREPDTLVQALYGRTLLGLDDATRVKQWTVDNQAELAFAGFNEEQLLEATWPLIAELLSERVFAKFSPAEAIAGLALGWIMNKPFSKLYEEFCAANGAKKWGEGTHDARIEDIVNICENAFGFECTLVLAAVAEVLGSLNDEVLEQAILGLAVLQKRFKYGVADGGSIALFELGFADRVIAGDLSRRLGAGGEEPMRQRLGVQEAEVRTALLQYPRYFTVCYNGLVRA